MVIWYGLAGIAWCRVLYGLAGIAWYIVWPDGTGSTSPSSTPLLSAKRGAASTTFNDFGMSWTGPVTVWYGMAWRARNGVLYGLVGTVGYMVWPGIHSMVYATAWWASQGIWYGLADITWYISCCTKKPTKLHVCPAKHLAWYHTQSNYPGTGSTSPSSTL